MSRQIDERPGVRRRALIGAAAAAGLALLAPGRGRRPIGPSAAGAATPRKFKRRLPIPRVLRGNDLTIPIKPAKVQILPGRKTAMWTYGGGFPGPTIRRPAGETTKVTFIHRLPKSVGELTVHLHGGHNTSADDGQPGGLTRAQPRSLYCNLKRGTVAARAGNNLLIRPGRKRTYTYGLTEDGTPERAAFQWYHDHRLEQTSRNVWRGLAGMWIIDDAVDSALPLPRGDRDIPLLITDRAFNRRNQLTNPFKSQPKPPHDGVRGPYILVNGAVLPFHSVPACRVRLRILNASPFRAYNLAFSGGVEVVQIATESGLMPAPQVRDAALIGPGERVELVADFSAHAGKRVELRSVARDGAPNAFGSKPYAGPIMQFRVGAPVADASSVPPLLRPLPAWVATAPTTPSFTWDVTVSHSINPTWLINGQTFDPSQSLVQPEVGSVATWKLVNSTATAHMMHLHQTDWYMLSRNGVAPAPWEACLKETFFMDPGDEIVIAGKLSDHSGKFVVHCHMLDHEDHGLMSQFEVVEPPAP